MMERSQRRVVRRSRTAPVAGKRMQVEQKLPWPAPGVSQQRASPPGYFTVELAMVFLCLTASLVFLPLILPPLPPPPFLLLLVPIGLLAVLVALAFVPFDGHKDAGSSCL